MSDQHLEVIDPHEESREALDALTIFCGCAEVPPYGGDDHDLNDFIIRKNTAADDKCCEIDMTTGRCMNPGQSSLCLHSRYGSPLPAEVLKEELSGENYGGLTWFVQLLPNDFDSEYATSKKLKGLDKRNYDEESMSIKPRRGMPAVKADDFFSSVVRIDYDYENLKPRWVFSGVLNGWPALTTLEVLRIEYKTSVSAWCVHWDPKRVSFIDEKNATFPTKHEAEYITPKSEMKTPFTSAGSISTIDSEDLKRFIEPSYPKTKKHSITNVRVVVRMPSWSKIGYSKGNKGHVFWYESTRSVPRVIYGENMIDECAKERISRISSSGEIEQPLTPPRVTRAHMIFTRNAPPKGRDESFGQMCIYHSMVLLEWDHGQYCTVADAAWLNEVGGYSGRCNWIVDKTAPVTNLFKCLPPALVAPWRPSFIELEVFDVPFKNLNEFVVKFMERHTGKQDNFSYFYVGCSHDVRLQHNTKEDIARYLINYSNHIEKYSLIQTNCQTFAADFCGFLAGTTEAPFHPFLRIFYRNRSHLFLMDPEEEGKQYDVPIEGKPGLLCFNKGKHTSAAKAFANLVYTPFWYFSLLHTTM